MRRDNTSIVVAGGFAETKKIYAKRTILSIVNELSNILIYRADCKWTNVDYLFVNSVSVVCCPLNTTKMRVAFLKFLK